MNSEIKAKARLEADLISLFPLHPLKEEAALLEFSRERGVGGGHCQNLGPLWKRLSAHFVAAGPGCVRDAHHGHLASA